MPLLSYVRETYGATLEPGFRVAHRPAGSSRRPRSDAAAADPVATLRAAAARRSHWDVAALQCATLERKLLIIGLALLDRVIDAAQAETLARLEEQVQIDRWGFVEGSHDYDVTRIRFRLASASLFADYCA